MRKLLLLIPACLVLVAAVPARRVVRCPLKPDPPPAIDGDLGEWYANPVPVQVSGKDMAYGRAKWKDDADLSGTLWLYWDKNYLYLAADVTDDRFIQDQTGEKVYLGDHLELYLDTKYDPAATGPFGEGQFQLLLSPGNLASTGDPLFDLPPEVSVAWPVGLSAKGVRIAAKRTEKGYALEAAIPWRFLGVQPERGMALGLDYCISDTDNPSSQDTMSSLVPGKWACAKREHLVKMVLVGADGK